jgi:DNA-binding CsgD family transcriptional regulator
MNKETAKMKDNRLVMTPGQIKIVNLMAKYPFLTCQELAAKSGYSYSTINMVTYNVFRANGRMGRATRYDLYEACGWFVTNPETIRTAPIMAAGHWELLHYLADHPAQDNFEIARGLYIAPATLADRFLGLYRVFDISAPNYYKRLEVYDKLEWFQPAKIDNRIVV